MQAGELRHRVTLQRPVPTRGADYAEVQVAWQDVATVWAAVEPLSAREFFQTRELQSELTTRIRLRWLAGVAPTWRVLFGARVFEIQSVINADEANVMLELLCAEFLGV